MARQMSRRCFSHRFCLPLLVAAGVGLCGNLSSLAGERYRTPAEIELRRAEVAARLAALADEERVLTARLAETEASLASAPAADRPALEVAHGELAGRIRNLVEERDGLRAEAKGLAALVTRNATGPLTRADPQGLSPVQIAGGSGQVSAGTAFNPAITVIPDGLYYNDNAGGRASVFPGDLPGFGVPGVDVEATRVPRGFSLREVELVFSGAVDPYFDVWATFGIGDGTIEPEEVYVQTRRFLPGTQVRFGRFLSGIGYLNRQHRHQWDFVDQALPYEAIFGSNLEEVGVQVTWLPAIPVYMQLGFEALQGDNVLIAKQLASQTPLLEETPGPRLFTGFLKVSPDLGYSNTLQAGLSFGRSRSHQEADPEEGVFDGSTWFLGSDWIWRYDSARPYGEGDLSVQGEYIYRSKSLQRVSVADMPITRISQQDGLYAQVVYGIGPRWTVGGRFDAAGLHNRIEAPTETIDNDAATRYAADVTFNPTEFSRLRVQYNYAREPGDSPARFHQVYVQFQMSLGVHGAHTF
jgi:hypothetical protein